MTRGPRRTPTNLVLLRGNPGHRRKNPGEPRPTGALIDPPDWFDEAQAERWRYIIECAPPGLLKKLDRGALCIYVSAEALHMKAITGIARTSLLTVGSMGQAVPNPLLKVAMANALIMLRAAAELGFTPASRSRIDAPAGGGGLGAVDPDDDFEAFLRS